ncbi:DUF461 domain-containing protein [Streptomyces sp. NPDC088387]|uniref:DUF461 domain-containing protein n=1 Tax=Streptomyces sp. NPDC088387 TaxID=3365859 RepID=UPI00381FCB9B
MSSSLRRGALAASAIAFSIASLAACGAGNNSQTLEIKPDNAATSVGDIKIQNAIVITQPDTDAAGPAAVSATLFNTGDRAQTLDSIAVDGIGDAAITPAGGKGKLTVPAGGSVILGGKDNASAVLSDGEPLTDGDAQKVTFTFSTTGDVSLQAFVVPADSFFTSWGPSEVPAAPGASGEPSGESSEGSSDEPSTGESDGATGEPADGTTGSPNTEESGSTGTPTDAASGSATATDTGADGS